MKRRLFYSLAAIVLLIVITSAGSLAWLLGTSGGARWIIGELSSRTAAAVSVEKVTGRLWDVLRLEGVKVVWPQGRAELKTMDLDWRPLSLLYGRIHMGKLLLKDLKVIDNRPEEKKQPPLTWPKVNIPWGLRATIRDFRMEGLSYRRLKKSAFTADALSGRVVWRGGTVRVEDMKAALPEGRIQGMVSAGFVKPALKADLAVLLSRPIAGFRQFSLRTELSHRKEIGIMQGQLQFAASSAQSRRVGITTGIGINPDSLDLDGIRVTGFTPRGEITGSGKISFPEGGPLFRMDMRLLRLDLSPFLKTRTDISGRFGIAGTFSNYHGNFDLANSAAGVNGFHASGVLKGGARGLELTSLEGSWLKGTLKGKADLGWEEYLKVETSLEVRGLDPSLISKDWTGIINADLRLSAELPKNRPLSAELDGRFLESRLRGQALTGEVSARLEDRNLLIRSLLLHGRGFDIAASGELSKRLSFTADVSDLAGILPGAKGKVYAKGWVRYKDKTFGGDVSGTARRVSFQDVKAGAADFTLHAEEGEGHPLDFKARASGLSVSQIEADRADVTANGTMGRHTVRIAASSQKASFKAEFQGGYADGEWKGRILSLAERDETGPLTLKGPAELSISAERLSVSSLSLEGTPPEHAEVTAELSLQPLQGFLQAEWSRASLGRANPWLKNMKLSGTASGKVYSRWLKGGLPNISGRVSASGTVTTEGRKIDLKTVSAQIESNEQRLLASFEISLSEGGEIKGHFASDVRAGKLIPQQGDIDAQLQGMKLSFFRHWMPSQIEVDGTLSGSLKGKLLQGGGIDLSGSSEIANGTIGRHDKKGEISVAVRTAKITFSWRETSLYGGLSLELTEYGRAEGKFRLPLPARLPVKMNTAGPVVIAVNGDFREKGLLSALFPGLVQETQGEAAYSLNVDGVWKSPAVHGNVKLSKAGAYLPTGGIRVKDVLVTARIETGRIIIDSFSASSGTGKIEGTAQIDLRGWTMAGYSGKVSGKDFQVIYLPELRVQASPDLTFEGTRKRLSVRGEINVPDMFVRESKTRAPVQPSKDVVVVERRKPPEREIPIALDIKVKVTLGKNALVKAEGVDAQLSGSVEFDVRSLQNISGQGEIRVVKGKYSAYGVNLDIVRGRVIFTGRQVNRPNLDVLALKTVQQIKAGVVVSGTLQHPVVKLYSDPNMPETDILAYIVLGHPLGSSTEQATLVARAAGFLLSASDSVVFQNQLKGRLGLDTLDIETAPTTTSTAAIPTPPPGVAAPPTTSSGGISRSLVTVGKYLTPELYISYGRSLFGNANLFRARYSFSKHWEFETESGTESGADIFYKIDFK